MRVSDGNICGLSQVIADGLRGEPANPPERKGDQSNDPERAPPARIEGLFGKARRHKAGDVNLLPDAGQ